MILVLVGASDVGKTAIGLLLSARLGWRFEDGDDYHPLSNRQKMDSGTPLIDEDGKPWLNVLRARMLKLINCNENAVLACSALKQKCRDLFVAGFHLGRVRFAQLDATRDLLEERIQKRHHQYLHPSLLGPQLATLEVSADAWRISDCGTPEEAAQQLLGHLKVASEKRS